MRARLLGCVSLRNAYDIQDVGAVRRAYTEANMEAEIQGQKLTEVITKLKGDLKTVAEVSSTRTALQMTRANQRFYGTCVCACVILQRNARLLRKMTEMQLLMTDASRKGLVSPQVLKEALELLKPGGKSKFIQAVTAVSFVLPRASAAHVESHTPALTRGRTGEIDRRRARERRSTRRLLRRLACVLYHVSVASPHIR